MPSFICIIGRLHIRSNIQVNRCRLIFSNILQSTRFLRLPSKGYGSYSGVYVFGELSNLLPILYVLPHNVDMMYWSIHSKFHMNPSSFNG